MKSRYALPLTKNEKDAMEIEIRKELAEWDEKNADEIDAMILWILHTDFGFGKKRLKKFYDKFNKSMEELIERYLMHHSELPWLCTHLLKTECDIDLKKWEKS